MDKEIRDYIIPAVFVLVFGFVIGIISEIVLSHTNLLVAANRRIVCANGLLGTIVGLVFSTRIAIIRNEKKMYAAINQSLHFNEALSTIIKHPELGPEVQDVLPQVSKIISTMHPFFCRCAAFETLEYSKNISQLHSGKYICSAIEEPFLTLDRKSG